MKKFLKYAVIIGCILVLAGTGIATVAFSLGGDPFRAAEDISRRFDSYGAAEDSQWRGPGTISYGTVVYEVTEETAEGLPGNDTFEMAYDAVTDLEIQIKGGMVTMETDPDIVELVLIGEAGRSDHISYRSLDRYQKLEIHAKEEEEYTIIIPEDWELNDIEVDCFGGMFTGGNIRAKDAEFSADGGEISVYQLDGKNTVLECAGGTISWIGVGEISHNIDVDCAGGEVMLTLDGEVDSEKVGYDMEYAAGVIDFFGTVYEGAGEHKRSAKDGMPYLELEVAGGVIRVQ